MIDPRKIYERVKAMPGYCKLNEISETFLKFIIMSEDSKFFVHKGFNIDSIRHNIKKNIGRRKNFIGASTISQQLAKNLYLSFEQSIARKIKEAFLTLLIEQRLNKNEILELYLNIIDFGNDQYGITNAARFYYSTMPSSLDELQSLFLVSIVPGPTYLNPLHHPDHFIKWIKLRMAYFKRVKIIDSEFINYVNDNFCNENLIKAFSIQGNISHSDVVPTRNLFVENIKK